MDGQQTCNPRFLKLSIPLPVTIIVVTNFINIANLLS